MFSQKTPITIISFIGKPFAGKDFQGARFRDAYPHVAVISTGALLRDQDFLIRSGFSPKDISYINNTRDSGKNVRNNIVEGIAHQAILEKAREGNTTIILTGYPRRPHQLKDMRVWEKEQRRVGELDISPLYIHFQINATQANARRKKRYEEEHRTDDEDLRKVRSRQNEFRKNVWPMLTIARARELFFMEQK